MRNYQPNPGPHGKVTASRTPYQDCKMRDNESDTSVAAMQHGVLKEGLNVES